MPYQIFNESIFFAEQPVDKPLKYSLCRKLLGRDIFLELGHFDKYFIYNTRKKSPAGKNFSFFLQEGLKIKNHILNEKFNLEMATIKLLFPRIGELFPIF